MHLERRVRAKRSAGKWAVGLAAIATFFLGAAAFADEGMWTFDRFPVQKVLTKYRFAPSAEWLGRLQGASVRIESGGGGSGSFVTPSLVVTNHHVASDCIAKVSSRKSDYVRDGFLAKQPSDELRCPDLELIVLEQVKDVTAKVRASERPDMTPSQVNEAHKAVMADLEKACTGGDRAVRCDVVTLYQGALFDLYKYHRYSDVRLVFAPEFQIAFFGGDPDNFTYPRYDLDVTFLRVYENGTPIKSKSYLPFSFAGPKDGELLFVSGHPGSTGRHLTMAQLEFLRDTQYPFLIARLRKQQEMLKAYGKASAEAERIAQKDLFSVENSLKATVGYSTGLVEREQMNAKATQEKLNQQRLPKALEAAKAGAEASALKTAWSDIAKATSDFATYYKSYAVMEASVSRESKLLDLGRKLYRLHAEREKPNTERLREYRDSAWPRLEQELLSKAPTYSAYEEARLAFYLEHMVNTLGAENPLVAQVLKGKTPKQVAKKIAAGTKVLALDFRKKWIAKKGDGNKDPLLALVALLDPEARRLRKRYEDEVESVYTNAGGRIGRALFAVDGTNRYPDATFTLRLSYGVAKGYKTNDGKDIPWTTRLGGAFEHATGKPPYDLPKSFMASRSRQDLRLEAPLNLVTTNDIIGGNSGSPLVNTNGELVGVIFDGNIESLPSRFYYSESQSRAVSVASPGIAESLEKIYKATTLLDEIRQAGKASLTTR